MHARSLYGNREVSGSAGDFAAERSVFQLLLK
jgi:hypothetical protein